VTAFVRGAGARLAPYRGVLVGLAGLFALELALYILLRRTATAETRRAAARWIPQAAAVLGGVLLGRGFSIRLAQTRRRLAARWGYESAPWLFRSSQRRVFDLRVPREDAYALAREGLALLDPHVWVNRADADSGRVIGRVGRRWGSWTHEVELCLEPLGERETRIELTVRGRTRLDQDPDGRSLDLAERLREALESRAT